jgi:hypothetical protein
VVVHHTRALALLVLFVSSPVICSLYHAHTLKPSLITLKPIFFLETSSLRL